MIQAIIVAMQKWSNSNASPTLKQQYDSLVLKLRLCDHWWISTASQEAVDYSYPLLSGCPKYYGFAQYYRGILIISMHKGGKRRGHVLDKKNFKYSLSAQSRFDYLNLDVQIKKKIVFNASPPLQKETNRHHQSGLPLIITITLHMYKRVANTCNLVAPHFSP